MRYSWAICTLFVVAVGCDTRRASASEADSLVLELGGARPVLRKVLDDVRGRTAAERGAPVEDLGASELSPRPKAPRYAILRDGETLSQLSQRTLGTWRRWEEIAELNHIETPHAVRPDTKLRLPEQLRPAPRVKVRGRRRAASSRITPFTALRARRATRRGGPA